MANIAASPYSDPVVVDRLYRHLKERDERKILPLYVDLADPPGGIGWRGRERPAFIDRVQPDLVLFLAVVHHLAITRTVPLDEIAELLRGWDAEIVAELPLPNDPKVEFLMRSKRDRSFERYNQDEWEAAIGRRFDVVYLDPPYASDLYEPLMALAGERLLAETGVAIAEHFHKRALPERIGALVRTRQKRIGDHCLSFYALAEGGAE